jgi:hypothetical protein
MSTADMLADLSLVEKEKTFSERYLVERDRLIGVCFWFIQTYSLNIHLTDIYRLDTIRSGGLCQIAAATNVSLSTRTDQYVSQTDVATRFYLTFTR